MSSLNQICADIQAYLGKNNQDQLHRNVKFSKIPTEDLDVLFSYFSINLICKLYGGNFSQQVKHFNARLQEKAAITAIEGSDDDELQFEPYNPAGIGDHQYAERIKKKVFRALERIISMDASISSHNQYVSAAKELLAQAEKTKLDAAEIMVAYEDQLLVLAEHLVENFLPKLGQLIKQELRDIENSVVKKMLETADPENDQIKIWKDEIDRVVRVFELKRYELLLAETMTLSEQVSEAFDFSKDLIDNYRVTSEIKIEDKNTAKLKEYIGKRP